MQKWVKNGKYTDFDYAQNDRLTADNFGRTDNIRIFSAGLCSLNDYYLSNKKLLSTDPGISFEQGYNAALNMNALVLFLLPSAFRWPSFLSKNSNSSIKPYCIVALASSSTIFSPSEALKTGTSSPSTLKTIKLTPSAHRPQKQN